VHEEQEGLCSIRINISFGTHTG